MRLHIEMIINTHKVSQKLEISNYFFFFDQKEDYKKPTLQNYGVKQLHKLMGVAPIGA